jgi:hypothetical protein
MVKNIKIIIFNFLLYFGMIWASMGIIFETYMLYLHFSDQKSKIKVVTNKMDKAIDKIR